MNVITWTLSHVINSSDCLKFGANAEISAKTIASVYSEVYSLLTFERIDILNKIQFHNKSFLLKLASYEGIEFPGNIPPEYLHDSEFLLELSALSPSVLSLVNKNHVQNDEFWLKVAERNLQLVPNADKVKRADYKHRGCIELRLRAVKLMLQNEKVRENKSCMIAIMKTIFSAKKFAGKIANADFFESLRAAYDSLIRFTGEGLKDDEEFISTIIDIDPYLFQLASKRLKGDYFFVQKLLSRYPIILHMASPELQNNSSLVMQALFRSSSVTEDFVYTLSAKYGQ
jgi:hypothetical protein